MFFKKNTYFLGETIFLSYSLIPIIPYFKTLNSLRGNLFFIIIEEFSVIFWRITPFAWTSEGNRCKVVDELLFNRVPALCHQSHHLILTVIILIVIIIIIIIIVVSVVIGSVVVVVFLGYCCKPKKLFEEARTPTAAVRCGFYAKRRREQEASAERRQQMSRIGQDRFPFLAKSDQQLAVASSLSVWVPSRSWAPAEGWGGLLMAACVRAKMDKESPWRWAWMCVLFAFACYYLQVTNGPSVH